RVVNLCRNLGFAVAELPDLRPVQIAGLKITCGRNEQIDSWLSIEAEGWKILNTNDCLFDNSRELAAIRSRLGSPDVLLTQFSYASWVGNREDVSSHRRAAQCKRDEMRKQAEILQPKWIVPFASFIWFCHHENYYMNQNVNRISDIFAYCS